MAFQFNWLGNNAVISFYGGLYINEIIDANGLLIGDPKYDNLSFQLWDFSNISDIKLNAMDMKILSYLDKGASNWNRNVKMGIVAIGEKATDLANEYLKAMVGANWTCQKFDNIEKALAWCKEPNN